MNKFNPIDPFNEETWATPISFYDWLKEHYTMDMWYRIYELNCRNLNLIDLNGIDGLPRLKRFDCSNNKLKNFRELTSCKELEYLNIDNNEMSDVRYINSLKKLKEFSCVGNIFSNNYKNSIIDYCKRENIKLFI